MARLLTAVSVIVLCALTLLSIADAQNPEELMITIYGGLTNIIEKNMNSPQRCIAEVEHFIKKHKGDIEKLVKVTEQNRQRAMQQDYTYTRPDMKKMQESFEAMAQSRGFQEMSRFMQAVQNFSMKNSEFGQSLGEAIGKMSPQKPDYYGE
jgi:methyl-accepting chemotaxis protein